MNSNTKKLTVGLLVVAVMAFGFTAALPTTSAATSGPSGEFIFGTPISTTVSDLNPLTVTNSLGTIIAQEIYADSLAFQWADGSLMPWLANSWTVTTNSTNAENITFHLNTAAQWVKGSSVVGSITANDVVFTFDAIKGNSSLDVYGIGPNLVSVTALNSSTVSFVFKNASALWLPYVATQTIVPASWASYDNGTPAGIGNFLNMGTVGQEISAGPFILQSITAEGATLLANTHFWKGVPHIQTFYVEEFKSTSASTLSLEDGAIQGELPSLSDYQALSSAANITNIKQVEPWTFYIWLNDSFPTYTNPHFRQGLAYAVNKTQIMTKAEDGLGSWGQGNFSFGGLPTVLKQDWAPNLTYYNYNSSAAVKQFEMAGYNETIVNGVPELVNNSTKKQLTLTIEEPPVSDWQAAGTFIQSDLKAIGINAVLLNVPFSTWGTDVFGANFSVLTYFGYVPPFSNPYLQLQQPYDSTGGWNFEHFSNQTLNSLFNKTVSQSGANFTTNVDKMQKLVDYLVPLIPIGNANNYYSYNDKYLAGFLPNLTIDNPYNLMQITSSYIPPSTGISSLLYYAVGGIVAVVVIGGAVAYVLRGKKGKEEK